MIIRFTHGRRVGKNSIEYIKKHPIGIYITRPQITPFTDPPRYHKGIYYINFRWKDKIRSIIFNFNV